MALNQHVPYFWPPGNIQWLSTVQRFILSLGVFLILASLSAGCGEATSAPDAGERSGLFDRSGTSGGRVANRTYEEGTDYTIWRRVRLLDQQGFGQPVEAYSLLIPHDWKVQGGVQWQMTECTGDLVQFRATISSPDGHITLDFFPNQSFSYSTDAAFQTSLQMGATKGYGDCRILQPVDGNTYMREVFLPYDLRKPRITKLDPITEMDPVVQELRRMMQQMQGPGRDVQVSVECMGAELDYGNNYIGAALAMWMNIAENMPDGWGGMTTMYSMISGMRMATRYPISQREQAEEILTNIMSSYRMNPEWDAAVQQVMRNISATIRQGIMDRSRIQFESTREISEMNLRSWEKRMDSQSQGAHQFSQAIRDVETWESPTGERLELSQGYDQAWSRGDGTYILSNDPLFDPNRALKERWDPMTRPNR
jgi:hypothetical protein